MSKSVSRNLECEEGSGRRQRKSATALPEETPHQIHHHLSSRVENGCGGWGRETRGQRDHFCVHYSNPGRKEEALN